MPTSPQVFGNDWDIIYIHIYIIAGHDDRYGTTWVHRINANFGRCTVAGCYKIGGVHIPSLTPLHQQMHQMLSGLVGHTGHQRWITDIAHVIRTTSIVQKPCSSAWLCIAGVRVASTFLQANSMSFPPPPPPPPHHHHHHQQQHHHKIII